MTRLCETMSCKGNASSPRSAVSEVKSHIPILLMCMRSLMSPKMSLSICYLAKLKQIQPSPSIHRRVYNPFSRSVRVIASSRGNNKAKQAAKTSNDAQNQGEKDKSKNVVVCKQRGPQSSTTGPGRAPRHALCSAHTRLSVNTLIPSTSKVAHVNTTPFRFNNPPSNPSNSPIMPSIPFRSASYSPCIEGCSVSVSETSALLL